MHCGVMVSTANMHRNLIKIARPKRLARYFVTGITKYKQYLGSGQKHEDSANLAFLASIMFFYPLPNITDILRLFSYYRMVNTL